MYIFNIWLHDSGNKVFVQESIKARNIFLLLTAIITKFSSRTFRSHCSLAAKITSDWKLPEKNPAPQQCVITNNLLSPAKCLEFDISPREQEVLMLLAEGFTYEETGDKLYISKLTVKTHVQNIFKKLDADCLMEARNRLSEPIM